MITICFYELISVSKVLQNSSSKFGRFVKIGYRRQAGHRYLSGKSVSFCRQTFLQEIDQIVYKALCCDALDFKLFVMFFECSGLCCAEVRFAKSYAAMNEKRVIGCAGTACNANSC